MLPEWKDRVDNYGCTKEDYYGRVVHPRFIIHKLPKHIMALYSAFGLGEQRLLAMKRAGISEVLIFYHPNENKTILYKATIEQWLASKQYPNTISGKVELQRMLPVEECEKDG